MLRRGASRTGLVAAALVAAAAPVAAGCAAGGPPVRASAGRVGVTLDDFLLAPQEIRAREGRLTVRVTNRGRVAHTLRVFRAGREVAGVRTLLPGASAQARVVLAPGAYKLVCILGNHEALGMYGTLTVR